MEKKLSIENLPLFESARTVNTPLSLEACKREGIAPVELLYRPPEYYANIDPSAEIQTLYFNFFERKRRQLIETILKTHTKLKKTQQSSDMGTRSNSNRELSVSEHRKLKENALKSISRVLSNEAISTNEMIKHHSEHAKNRQEHEERMRFRAQLEKQKFDLKTMKDEERARIEAKKLKDEKRKTGEKFKNRAYDKDLETLIREQREKEMEVKRQQKMKSIEEHIRKMEEHLRSAKHEREKKMRDKEEKDKRRRKWIKKQTATCREFYSDRNQKKIDKKIKAEKKFKEDLMMRKKLLEQKIAEEHIKCSEFFNGEQKKLTEKIRCRSEERMRKSTNAKTFTEAILKYRKEKFQEKTENLQNRLRTNEEIAKKKEEYRNHKELLKQLNKDYNIMRLQKSREYYEKNLKEKIREDEMKVKSLKENRDAYEKMRNEVNHNELIDKEKLVEVVQKVKIDKKWNYKPVKKLLAYSHFGSAQSNIEPFSQLEDMRPGSQ